MPAPAGATQSQRLIAAPIAALVTVLLFKSAGLLGLTYLFVAVPVAYATMRFGAACGLGAFILTAFGLYGIYGLTDSLFEYMLVFGAPSLLLPHLLLRNWGWDRAAAVTVIAAVLFTTGLATGAARIEEVPLGVYVDRQAEAQLDQIRALFPANKDLSAEQQREIRQYLQSMQKRLQQTFPALVIVVSVCIALLTVWLLTRLSDRYFAIPGERFISWRTPEPMVWVLIGAGFLYVAGKDVLQTIGLNLLVVLLLVYYIHGLAILTNLFERRQLPRFMRVMGYLMTLFNPLPLIVAGIGVFDLWVDFRKLRVKGN